MGKPNRSSIIKIIISNYDNKGIKEVKVRYNKQAQLDTFLIKSELKDGKFILYSIVDKAREKYRYSFEIDKTNINKNEILIIKKDIYSNKEDKVIRKYILSFEVSEKNDRTIVTKIKDCLETQKKEKFERENTRRLISETERKLLSEETQKTYSKIACCSPEDIDSVKIYKIKRYLAYRSNMLLFFSLINDIFVKGVVKDNGEEVGEIWRIIDSKEIDEKKTYDLLVENFKKRMSQEFINYKQSIENKIEKNTNKIKEIEQKLKKEKYKKEINRLKKQLIELNRENDLLEKDKIELSDEEIREDIEKILKIYSDLRHKLMHYNYQYFENLFENKKISKEKNEDVNLTELLDLNLFRYLPLVRQLKLENKTNYLEKEDKITVLGVSDSAIKYYSYYNFLCEQKNGFNNFINSFFSNDGEENKSFKEKINLSLEKEIEIMEKETNEKIKEINKNELQLMKEQKELGTAYVLDIHSLNDYKISHNERNKNVKLQNDIMNGNRDKNALDKINKKLVELKIKMDKITKRNSILRLKYKLQVAYGFLMEEYKGNIKKFKDEFDISKEKIKSYKSKGEKYLEVKSEKKYITKILNSIEDIHNITWLKNQEENNLFKFYVLTYILLPFEFRGDFLGFVKKHYYDIKNVEFLDENNDRLTPEQLEKMKNDSFFNKIRLFEKNSKKYDILKESILTSERIGKYFSLLNTGAKYFEYGGEENRGIFNKNIIIPIFKYYQIVLKLYNDVELAMLLTLSESDEKDINKIKELVTLKEKVSPKKIDYEKKYKFSVLLDCFNRIINLGKKDFLASEEVKEVAKTFTNLAYLRNKICHLNYSKFIDDLLTIDTNKSTTDSEGKLLINDRIRKLIKFIRENNQKMNISIDYNYINDYYMKKEKFIFGQRKQAKTIIDSGKKANKRNKAEELLKMYRVKKENINLIYELSKKLNELTKSELFLLDKKLLKDIDFTDVKIKNKSFFELKNDVKEVANIKQALQKHSSELIGIYKKEVIMAIKRSIVSKLIYDEEKVLSIIIYDKTNKKYEDFLLEIRRERDINKFQFLIDEKKEKLGYEKIIETKEKKKVVVKIQNNSELVSEPRIIKNKDKKKAKTPEEISKLGILDLTNHYCFNLKITL
ncbi:type VI-C CRISPR-associated RNA-guided ribonuclease Cas13c [Fusobacterium perfoetens]|uniref:type VI-C CRISPR-associated RNA-guided ribonuclease Cas13c n=1 Tax=Fusobacterium perfoetens TaxID=852 RepID=UPI0004817C16|nr:type VI-C CRISPR-associated RNA-guided ribonuclease Cas13c [Fusobacterium perfoetens]